MTDAAIETTMHLVPAPVPGGDRLAVGVVRDGAAAYDVAIVKDEVYRHAVVVRHVVGGRLVPKGHKRNVRVAALQASEPQMQEDKPKPQEGVPEGPQGGRSREAHSGGGIAIARRNFLVLSGAAAMGGLVAGGLGRVLGGTGASGTTSPAPLNVPGTAGQGSSGVITHETLPEPPPGAQAFRR